MLLFIFCCSSSQPKTKQDCPRGFFQDKNREESVYQWFTPAKVQTVCWGKTNFSVVDPTGRVLLRTDLSPPQAAARLAHLDRHIGVTPPTGERCLEWWVQHEASAMSIELDLLEKWQVSTDSFSYAKSYFKQLPENKRQYLIDFIYAHPSGAKGMDGLLNAYTKRCEEK